MDSKRKVDTSITALEEQFRSVELTGCLIQIRQGNSQPLTYGLGELANLNQKDEALFPIYSIAKPILSLLTLALRDLDRVSIDGPIQQYVRRELPDWLKTASLRHLLSHRSGLSDYGPMPDYHETVKRNPSDASDRDRFIEKVFEKGSQFSAGEGFCYSNVGYALVREILEAVSETNIKSLFNKFIGERVEVKMEFLKDTSSKMILNHSPYLSEGAPNISNLYNFSWVLHGTFLSTLNHLTSLFSQLDKIISSQSLEEMINLLHVDFQHPYFKAFYGLGLMGDATSEYGHLYGHTGSGPGFSVATFHLPEKDLTIATVVNNDSTICAEKITFDILKSVHH